MAGLSKVLAEQTGGLRLVNKVLLQPALAAGGTPAGDEGLLQDLQAFHQKAAASLSAAQVCHLSSFVSVFACVSLWLSCTEA